MREHTERTAVGGGHRQGFRSRTQKKETSLEKNNKHDDHHRALGYRERLPPGLLDFRVALPENANAQRRYTLALLFSGKRTKIIYKGITGDRASDLPTVFIATVISCAHR